MVFPLRLLPLVLLLPATATDVFVSPPQSPASQCSEAHCTHEGQICLAGRPGSISIGYVCCGVQGGSPGNWCPDSSIPCGPTPRRPGVGKLPHDYGAACGNTTTGVPALQPMALDYFTFERAHASDSTARALKTTDEATVVCKKHDFSAMTTPLHEIQAQARASLVTSPCVDVHLGSRHFVLSQPLQLTQEDSHTHYIGEGATISGAVVVPTTELQPLSAAQRRLFKPAFADRIRAISLSKLGVEADSLKPLTYAGGNACIMANVYRTLGVELFSGQERYQMARWPKLTEPVAASNWARIIAANSSGYPINLTLAPSIATALDSPAQLAAYQAQVSRGDQLYAHGLWMVNWADTHRRVEKVDPFFGNDSIGLLTLGHSCPVVPKTSIESYCCDGDAIVTDGRTHGGQGGHFYVYNALWDLDTQGDYVVHHNSSTVFVLPFAEGSELSLTKATSLVNASGTTGVTFTSVEFSGVRGSAILLNDCKEVLIRDSLIRQVGLNAFNVSGGKHCGLVNVSVSVAGQGCVALEGGNRTTLTRSDHFVNESSLVDCQRWTYNYAPNVLMAGVGQSVSHSSLINSPQQAVFVMGNEHTLQDSSIINATMQCSDCGAYYFGRNPTYRGHLVLRNRWQLPGSIWGGGDHSAIYADDFASSAKVELNTFLVGHGMHLLFFANMGRDFHFTRNVIAPLNGTLQHVVGGDMPVAQVHNKGCASGGACDSCFTMIQKGTHWRHGNVYAQFLFDVPFNTSAIWEAAFPRLASLLEDRPCQASGNVVADNIVCYPPSMVAGFVACEGSCAGTTIEAKFAAFGSVTRNNSYDTVVCGSLNK